MTADSPLSEQPVPRIELAPGYSVPRIINGCWQLSSGHGGSTVPETELFKRMDRLVSAGFNCFDVADIYTGVEETLGRYVKTRGQHDLQVHTKFVPDLGALPTLTGKDVEATIHRSLNRLGTDYLDLVQFHWWDYRVPGYLEALNVLGEMRTAGKIRQLGLTNFDTAHLEEILASGAPAISIQLQYSLLDRRPLKQMADACETNDIAMLCYGVLAGGLFSTSYLAQEQPPAPNRSVAKYLLMIKEVGGWQAFTHLLETLSEIAAELGCDIAALAGHWVLNQNGVRSIIIGLGNSDRLDSNLAMLTLELNTDHVSAIKRALDALEIPAGDVFELERMAKGPHAAGMKMNLNSELSQ